MENSKNFCRLWGTVLGGEFEMIFDNFDFEFLRLCGLCRYVPTGLSKKYESPILKSNVIVNLQEHGLIKTQSDGLSYKLTSIGRKYLADMGYEFPYEEKVLLDRNAYKRKLINARLNVLLYLAGINVFFSHPFLLKDVNTGYVSSLLMRADNNVRQLAGTRFLGVLKIENTIYIPYSILNTDDWIIPSSEKEIFTSSVENTGEIKDIKILLVGEALEELWNFINISHKGENLPYGRKYVGDALEVLGFEYLLVPLTKTGVFQMRILTLEKYRERIAFAIGCDTKKHHNLSECDGIKDNVAYIIAIDFNIERIVKAINQVKRYSSKLSPIICCLGFQKETLKKVLNKYNCFPYTIMTFEKQGLYNALPELDNKTAMRQPFMTNGGEWIEVNYKNFKKYNPEER